MRRVLLVSRLTLWLDEQTEEPRALVICMQPRHTLRGVAVEGSRLASCKLCAARVWVSPSTREASAFGAFTQTLVCCCCAEAHGPRDYARLDREIGAMHWHDYSERGICACGMRRETVEHELRDHPDAMSMMRESIRKHRR